MTPEALAPFEPRWEEGRLVLVLRRLDPTIAGPALLCGLSAFAAVVLLSASAVMAGAAAALSLAALVTTGWKWRHHRSVPVRLVLGEDHIVLGGITLDRDRVQAVEAQDRRLRLQIGGGRRPLEVANLDHPEVDIATLGRLVRTWATDPAFGPDHLATRVETDASLQERLQSYDPRLEGTGLAIPVVVDRRRDLLGWLLFAPVVLLGAMISLDAAVFAVAPGLLAGAGAVMLLRNRRWTELVVDDRGLRLQHGFSIRWDELEAATLGTHGELRLHRGGQVFQVRARRDASRLATVLTDLATEADETQVPEPLRQLRARRDMGGQEA